MSKKVTLVTALWLLWLGATVAQPLCRVVQYDEEDGVPSSHVTQLLQDGKGFMWFATWNGLCRYDGYEFQTFKPQAGDGCHMTTERIRDMTLLPSGHILCQLDNEHFVFDLRNYRFRDLTDDEQRQVKKQVRQYRQSRSLRKPKGVTWTDAHQTQWTLHGDGRLVYQHPDDGQEVDYPLAQSFRALTFAMADDHGILWALDYGSIYKFCTDVQHTRRLDMEPRAEVKCLFRDQRGRYWMATKDEEAVRVYGRDNRPLGYLGADGRLHGQYTRFGAAVYCMYESQDGTLWLGTKPKGLFRLRQTADGAFKIDHFTDMPCLNVYHVTEDRFGRLWVATLGGGLCYTANPQQERPRFVVPRQYPTNGCERARYVCLTKGDIMLVATSGGLLVTRLLAKADDMRFQLHQREPDRVQSLSSSATMDIVEDRQGRLFVSTESGGVNEILGSDLLKEQLDFRPINVATHQLPSDVVQSLTTTADGKLLIVGGHLVSLLDTTRHIRVFDSHYFHADYRFSEARPLQLDDGRWLFGLTDGAFVTSASQLDRQAYSPRMVLTSASIQDGGNNWAVETLDTLTLRPHERNVTIHFAALDYHAPERINYAFRLLPHEQWNYIGHDRSATLLDLEPGTYLLEIRSTNADGEWQSNQRTLTLIVQPTFWESALGRLLLTLLSAGFLAAVIYTLLYIRRIKRKQRETLEKYLNLIEVRDRKPKPEYDPMLQRVMKFVEDNISNSDANVGDMAAAAATSRSGLQRKLKQAMGVTPQDLLREARIKRACQLLRQTDKTISEVAYACGFTDPKYFSRSFKQSTGQSPSEMRNDCVKSGG